MITINDCFVLTLPAPDRAPRIISKKLKGQSVNIAWEQVEPMANESSIDGYRVSTVPRFCFISEIKQLLRMISFSTNTHYTHVPTQILYRQEGQSTGTLYTTIKRSIDLPLPANGNYVVEVRAHTEGGDGAMAKIQVAGKSSFWVLASCCCLWS